MKRTSLRKNSKGHPSQDSSDNLVELGGHEESVKAGLLRYILPLRVDSMQELDLEYDEEFGSLWCIQRHSQRPNFTTTLIDEIRAVQIALQKSFENLPPNVEHPVNYMVWASHRKNIFNLGGDLTYFVDMLSAGDKQAIYRYARSCIEICHTNYIDMNIPITTIALGAGDALGGGLESMVSSDVVIVERSAQFGFPEILFGLFPGMGAYSTVVRRANDRTAREMIFSGKIYRGDQIHDMGLADIVAPDGETESHLHSYLKNHHKKLRAHQALYNVRRKIEKLTWQEMCDIADLWVETAMELTEQDIKKMRRLAKAQIARLEKEEELGTGSQTSKEQTSQTHYSEIQSRQQDHEPTPSKPTLVKYIAEDESIPQNIREKMAELNEFTESGFKGSPYNKSDTTDTEEKSSQGTAAVVLAGPGILRKDPPVRKPISDFSENFSHSHHKEIDKSKEETFVRWAAGDRNPHIPEAPTSTTDTTNANDQESDKNIYDRILNNISEAQAAAVTQSGLERVLTEGMDAQAYLHFLRELYHIVRHTCPTMAAAASRCDEELTELRDALYQKINEKKGHEKWVLDDVHALGENPEQIIRSEPSVPLKAMIGYNYHMAERGNPWAVLGMLHVLEEISFNYSGRIMYSVSQKLGIRDGRGLKFLGAHSVMGSDQAIKFGQLVNHVRDDKDIAAITEAAEVNFTMFGSLFR